MMRQLDEYPDTTLHHEPATNEHLQVSIGDVIDATAHSRLQAIKYPYAASAVLGGEIADATFSHEVGVIDALILDELADAVSPQVLAFIRRSIESRMLLRDGTNKAAYSVRLHRDAPLAIDGMSDHERIDARHAVDGGYASMRQVDAIRQSDGMGSMEYGSLTIIGDKRREHLADMYGEASQLVGHDVSTVDPYRIEVIGFDREPDGEAYRHMGAMRIAVRRHLGYLSDGAELKQRTVAIVDLRPSTGIDPAIVAGIFSAYDREKESKRQVKIARKVLKAVIDRSDEEAIISSIHAQPLVYIPEELDLDYAKIPEIQKLIEWLVAQDMQHPTVLARNETIYAVNRDVNNQIAEQQQQRDSKLEL